MKNRKVIPIFQDDDWDEEFQDHQDSWWAVLGVLIVLAVCGLVIGVLL